MKKLWKPALLLAAVAVMVIGMLGSGAWWTDQKTSPESEISAGNLELNEDGVASFNLGTIKMAPGDKTDEKVIYILNSGTTNLFWLGDLVVDGDETLKKAVYIDYGLMQFEGGNWAEADDNFISNGVGAGLYPSAYNALAQSNIFGKIGLDVFDGSNHNGTAPYEFYGALKPGYAYKLTLKFGFAELADDSYQNLGPLNISFKVDATQPTKGAIEGKFSFLDGTYWANWAAGTLGAQN